MVSVTVGEMLRRVTEQLKAAGCDSPAFDARCLLEDIGKVGRGRVEAQAAALLSAPAQKAVRQAADRRAAGYPLQYLLGEWDFLDLTLSVGEGVLIPRPETELLCETAGDWLREKGLAAPRVLDLCAGSGCVGLGIASLYPGAQITAVELSGQALEYLRRNRDRYPAYVCEIVQADVLRDAGRFAADYHLIVSNPPYIPAGEIDGLMREVQHEPRMALDGGDGLVFYRALARLWQAKLLPGGAMMVEVGAGQAQAVAALWEQAGLAQVRVLPDAAGIGRVVAGEKI